MKEWFSKLQAREQLVVASGGGVVLIILLWALLWLPLDRGHDNMRQSVSAWETSLAELRAIVAHGDPDANADSNASIAAGNQSPMVVVDQTLRERSLNSAVKRRQPTPNGIRIEFENVAFDQLVVWLGELSRDYGMDVQAGSLSLASRAGPGRINASITLERAR